jgi:hypothetical protein
LISANRQPITANGIKPVEHSVSQVRPARQAQPAGTGTTEEDLAMHKFGFATLLTSTLAAAVIGLTTPAQAAPSGVGNAEQTISQLQAQGYTVIVNHIGNRPLDQAAVVRIRGGQTYSRTDSGVPGAGNDLLTTVTNRTVYVDVK